MGVNIHPLALVGKKAQLGENVTIGPSAILGDDVIIGDKSLLHPMQLFRTERVLAKDAKSLRSQSSVAHRKI